MLYLNHEQSYESCKESPPKVQFQLIITYRRLSCFLYAVSIIRIQHKLKNQHWFPNPNVCFEITNEALMEENRRPSLNSGMCHLLLSAAVQCVQSIKRSVLGIQLQPDWNVLNLSSCHWLTLFANMCPWNKVRQHND